jgi:hypothetical protein
LDGGFDVDVSGHLDLCGPKLVEGWILDAQNPKRRIHLQVFAEDVLLGECIADRLRPDLREAGMGDGHCAFSFAIPARSVVTDFSKIRLRIATSVLYLLPDSFTRFQLTLVEPAQPLMARA